MKKDRVNERKLKIPNEKNQYQESTIDLKKIFIKSLFFFVLFR